MKSYTPEWLAAIAAGDAVSHGAVKIVPRGSATGVALCFALDRSTSMAGDRLATMKSAMATVLALVSDAVETGVPIDLSVVSFGAPGSSITKRTASAGDVDDVDDFVQALTAAATNTDFRVGMDLAETFFAATSGAITERFLFFITDGEPTAPPATATDIATDAGATLAGMAGVQSYGINIELTDTTYTEFVDNTASDGVPIVSGVDPSGLVDAVTSALLAGGSIGAVAPLRLWSGGAIGQELELDAGDGPEVYIGVGDRGLITVTGRRIGTAEQAIELSLSGVDPDINLDTTVARDAVVIIWRLGFDSSGRNLLDATIFDRGRVDDLFREETVGGEAIIRLMVEGAARGLGRATNRMCTDADQRNIRSDDAGFSRISYAAQKKLYWGGPKPLRDTDVPVIGLPS